MRKTRFKGLQIIAVLREVAGGAKVQAVCRRGEHRAFANALARVVRPSRILHPPADRPVAMRPKGVRCHTPKAANEEYRCSR